MIYTLGTVNSIAKQLLIYFMVIFVFRNSYLSLVLLLFNIIFYLFAFFTLFSTWKPVISRDGNEEDLSEN